MRHLYRSYRSFWAQNQVRLLNVPKRFDSTATSSEKIVIPKRIHRSPTDILYALSATVGNDPTAAHYKYHDDPFLIPQSNQAKRSFALAQEAGRNAARWIKQEHSKLFQHKHADPPIPAYVPTMVYTEDSEVNESSLEQLITNSQVSDAILVYNLMVKRNLSISSELRQSFLELICFNNHEDSLSEDLYEERWFSRSFTTKERQRKTWKDNDLAESVFNEIEPKSSQAYCAIIRGMCKFIQVERGYALFQDALQRDLQIDVATFNSVINVISFLREGGHNRWQLVLELLQTMVSRKVKPNIGTMNAVLSVISTVHGTVAREYALQTLAEFKELGIAPTLETWYFVLSIFYRERSPISHVLFDIMKEIEGKEFEIQGMKDMSFFVAAMNVCQNELNDKDLAKRVDNLLHVGHNYDLIGGSLSETVYYRQYFTVLCNNEPLDVFMETYNALVPNIYIPEPIIMTKILTQVDINGALELIPRLWSDIVIFELLNQEKILDLVLKIMVDNKPSNDIPAQANLSSNFADIAWQIFNRIEEQSERQRNPVTWSGKMISDVLTLACRAEDSVKAQKIFDKINKDQDVISGIADPAALELFIKLSVSKKQPSKAIAALQYCVENSFSNNQERGRYIVNAMTLDGNHISKITSLVGTEVLKGNE
ncbi:protein PTCD3 homolog, mitochondrial [Bradysia coprophila]|uniref:protein PTCD3 homolog, mitochondrial n=1 Tax=Bradysia coprophila TaxID=38358 RepID=UPI00187D9813|nr:protein PTCD3 homolog, mitochondrial [Bradysia coprophila]